MEQKERNINKDKNINLENLKDFKENYDNIIPKRATLTQAEYDALSYEEKHNDTIYFVTDGVANITEEDKEYIDNQDTHILNSAKEYINDTVKNYYTKTEADSLLNAKANEADVTAENIGLGNVENKSSETIRSEITKTNVTNALGFTPPTAEEALTSAKDYTNEKISDLINGAPTTLDTLGEIAQAMTDNKDVVEALDEAIGTKATSADLTAHTENTSNPHSVTKEQVGLSNVPNVATNDQTPTYSDTTTFATLSSGEKISEAFAKIKLAITNLINHIANKTNPHEVTKEQLGLENVENKSSADIRGELTKSNVTTALTYTPPKNGFTKTQVSFTYTSRENNSPIGSCTISNVNDGFLIVTSNYAQYVYLITSRSSITINKISAGSEAAPSAIRTGNNTITISNIPYMGDMTGWLTVWSFN